MSLGEFDIIARYFARHRARSDVLLGIGDDAAVLAVPSERRLVTAIDTIVEGVHFPVATHAADIGYRALAVNLSDLAAMGAEPAWMQLSLSLPRADEQWLSGFAQGLFELADRHDVALIGGDTVKGPLVITVQIGGWVEQDGWLTRAGARPGDAVYVSGIPGEAAGGLATILNALPPNEATRQLQRRFFRPEPRVALGRGLRTLAHAAMDVSDGLLTDLEKLCAASHCGAELNVDALPESRSLRELFSAEVCVDYALAGGDDYEIIAAIDPSRASELERNGLASCLTRIGVFSHAPGVRCIRNGLPFELQRRGYDHFAQSAPDPQSS
jgi:thiamine-monophosphate kinase